MQPFRHSSRKHFDLTLRRAKALFQPGVVLKTLEWSFDLPDGQIMTILTPLSEVEVGMMFVYDGKKQNGNEGLPWVMLQCDVLVDGKPRQINAHIENSMWRYLDTYFQVLVSPEGEEVTDHGKFYREFYLKHPLDVDDVSKKNGLMDKLFGWMKKKTL